MRDPARADRPHDEVAVDNLEETFGGVATNASVEDLADHDELRQAITGLRDFGLRLFHTADAGLMVLVWQLGTVAGLSALAALSGRRIIRPAGPI